jgi:hypothetical protein
MLIPEACCGNEFVWHARCAGCGGWRWFHSREDGEFVKAVKETARRRNEPGGLSPEGTREAHAAFEATVPACGCGGRFRVVMDVAAEACTGCGRPFGPDAIGRGKRAVVEVGPLRCNV